MKIKEHFIQANNRIQIISNNGEPVDIPEPWRPVLGDCDIMVVIPDLHMYIHDSPLDNFKYGKEALISLLNHIRRLKYFLEDTGNSLRLYQLGDMYEFRFRVPMEIVQLRIYNYQIMIIRKYLTHSIHWM